MKKSLIGLSAIALIALFVIKAQVPFPGGGGSGGGGTIVTISAPYIVVSGTKYVAETGFPFTTFFSGSFLDANTCTLTASTSGSENFSCNLTTANAWYSTTATTSIEAEFKGANNTSGISTIQGDVGIWICDTTNSKIYLLEASQAGGNANIFYQFTSWTETACAGTPSGASTLGQFEPLTNGILHFKMSKNGGNLVTQISQDGGATYQTLDSRAIGTIAKAGVSFRTFSTNIINGTFLSTVVN